MMARVAEHNRLNGYGFVVAEFAILAGAASVFVFAYGRQARWIEALVPAGIAVNALVILYTAARPLLRGEVGVGLWRVYTNRAVRVEVAQSHPELSQDTLRITLAVLVPFALSLLAIAEALMRPRRA